VEEKATKNWQKNNLISWRILVAKPAGGGYNQVLF